VKRDVDLSRAILRFVEEHAPPQGGLGKPLEVEGYDRPTVLAHAELLIEDGLVDGRVSKGLGGPVNVVIIKLTSRGHDALQAIENDSLWHKVKKMGTEKGVSLTLDLAVALAKSFGRQHLGLH
jgi:hypothetical protein